MTSFFKFLPANVTINTPDFLKPVIGSSIGAESNHKDRNVLTKQKGPHGGQQHPHQPDSQLSTTGSVNESELANGGTSANASNAGSTSRAKNDARGKKRKDAPTATETFYIVRPPPSVSNHPLNLQVQLLATAGDRERALRRSASRSGSTDAFNRSANASRETLNEDPTSGGGLKRTASIRSNKSETESVASTVASAISTGSSTGSGSRKMIPLYNLQAHNVMTNSVTDAGTDAKIAKFFKRGLEIMGLAVVEPIEVFGKYIWDDTWDSLDPAACLAAGLMPPAGIALSTQVSRTISHLSNNSIQRTISPSGSMFTAGLGHTSASELTPVPEIDSPTTPKPGTAEKEQPKKQLFGGLFNKKKKEPPTPLALGVTSPTRSDENIKTPRSTKGHSAHPSFTISSPLPGGIAVPDSATGSGFSTGTGASGTTVGATEVILQPQILGLQAVLQSPANPPRGKPSAYVWVVRRWIRGSEEGFIGGLGAMADSIQLMAGAAEKHGHGMEVEVRFEWKRCGKTKGSASKQVDRRRHSIGVESRNTSTSHEQPSGPTLLDPNAVSSPSSKRLSFQGFGHKKAMPTSPIPVDGINCSNDHLKVSRAPSPNPPASIATNGTNEDLKPSVSITAADESDDDSDPEDSERPWNCYMHIRGAPSPGTASSSRTGSRDEVSLPAEDGAVEGRRGGKREKPKSNTLDIRVRVAALAPAPHHPKVIAQIKSPYPLPDVVFDPTKTSAELRQRDGSHRSLVESLASGSKSKPLILTSEDVKDVVSCTGLWLVVREGYGGLARKRKGDGWRLRG